MPAKCIVCAVYQHKNNPERSFHRWPNDFHIRAAWQRSLGLVSLDITKKVLHICSDHFKPQDFEVRCHGGIDTYRNYLKKNVMPIRPQPSPKIEIMDVDNKQGDDQAQELIIRPAIASENLLAKNSTLTTGSFTLMDTQDSVTQRAGTPSGTAGSSTDTAHNSSSTLTASEFGTNSTSLTPLKKRLQAFEDPEVFAGKSLLRPFKLVRSHPGLKKRLRITSEQHRAPENHSSEGSTTLSIIATPTSSPKSATRPKKRLKRKHYIGDLTADDFSTRTKAKRNLQIVQNTVTGLRKKIQNLQKSRNRLKARVYSLNSLLNYLRDNNMISENAQLTLQGTMPDSSQALFENMLKGPRKQKYHPSLRSFAMTLHFYSPKAYSYVRQKFNKTLPHPVTISKWYQHVNGEPGFTTEALEALKIKVKDAESKKFQIICNLVMDEVAIRQQIEWDGKKYYGFVNCGFPINSDTIPEAKEALVLMVVGINTNWKIPIGYFLSNGLNGTEKASIVTKALEFIHQSGVIVSSVTFDGAPSNFTMATNLGADFSDHKNLKPFFLHPNTNKKVYILLDPSHMIKLVRNCFGEYGNLHIEGRQISWDYLKSLLDVQSTEGLVAANKFKKRHLLYTKEKMKVKLATQTLSKSVATALNYLRTDVKDPKFKNSEETENCLLIFNDVFDILNSTSRYAAYQFKRALTPINEEIIFKRLEEAKIYIFNLEYAGRTILSSGRKCGFLGLLIDIESLKQMYQTYVSGSNSLLKYLLLYKFSQDHLEIFFCAIRSRGGHNNNPSAKQFESAYKRLLIHIEVKDSETGNATAIDSTSILHCNSSGRKTTVSLDGEDLLNSLEYRKVSDQIKKLDFITSSAWHLTTYSNDIVKYIAGFVTLALKKCVSCVKCLEVISTEDSPSLLQRKKTFENAKMCSASKLVNEICIMGEKCFRVINKDISVFHIQHKLIENLTAATFRHLPLTCYDHFGDHILDMEPLSDHFLNLIKLILKKYFNIRIYHETRKRLEANVGTRVRSVMTKTVLFKHQ